MSAAPDINTCKRTRTIRHHLWPRTWKTLSVTEDSERTLTIQHATEQKHQPRSWHIRTEITTSSSEQLMVRRRAVLVARIFSIDPNTSSNSGVNSLCRDVLDEIRKLQQALHVACSLLTVFFVNTANAQGVASALVQKAQQTSRAVEVLLPGGAPKVVCFGFF